MNLRDLPAVEPLAEWPERYSQTFLRTADQCRRAGYLYVKHGGGVPSHELHRGSAIHAVIERMIGDLLAQGERSMVGEDGQADGSMVSALVDEVLRENPGWVLPVGEADAVRVMAWHAANALTVDPERVLGVERKFVMDVAGRVVSGKLDLALLTDTRTAEVVDWKSSFFVPEADEYRKAFQPRFYAALLCFGFPVHDVPCQACGGLPVVRDAPCSACGGRGKVEVREPRIGEHLGWVRCREVYPRYLLESGQLRERDHIFSRTDLADFMVDLERLIAGVDEAREGWRFPAVAGSHCSMCPAAMECPLPARLRSFAGVINTAEQAAEAAEWADVMADRVAATNKEVKAYAAAHEGRVRYGRDVVREFVSVEGRAVRRKGGASDWDGLVEAVDRAANFGEPFEVGEWIRPTASTQFKRRVLSAAELDEEADDGERVDERSADEKWGADAPF